MPEYITKERAMDCVYEAVKATDANVQDLYAIRRKIAKEPGIGWVSVEDRLPGIDEDVLILYKSKVSRKTGYAITRLTDSFYFGSTPIPYQTPQWVEPWQYFRENNDITHWMLLPEPPEEVNRDA